MHFIIILISIFILVSFLPIIQLAIGNKAIEEGMEYDFPKELFECDLENLKFEHFIEEHVDRMTIQNRGSVRLAQGRILSVKNMEEKKVKAYSVELP